MPGRWWTHYFNSNADMRAYAAERGVPAGAGSTTLVLEDGVLTATTEADGVPVIRTTATVGDGIAVVGRGQLRYVTEVGGELISGLYPFHAPLVGRLGGHEPRVPRARPPGQRAPPGGPPRGDLGLLLALGVLLLPRRRGAARDAAVAA